MKVNGNPVIAYNQGKEIGRVDGVYDGFMAATYVLAIAYKNIVNDYIPDSENEAKFFKALEKENTRILTEEFKNDPINISERVEYHVNEVRRSYGMVEI